MRSEISSRYLDKTRQFSVNNEKSGIAKAKLPLEEKSMEIRRVEFGL